MNTTTSFTLADAASGTGMLKSSILSAIKSCRLSGTRGEFGQLRIEAEELHRELAGTRRQAAEKAQHPLDPCVEGRMRTGQREDAANHSSQGESNDCWSRRRFR